MLNYKYSYIFRQFNNIENIFYSVLHFLHGVMNNAMISREKCVNRLLTILDEIPAV